MTNARHLRDARRRQVLTTFHPSRVLLTLIYLLFKLTESCAATTISPHVCHSQPRRGGHWPQATPFPTPVSNRKCLPVLLLDSMGYRSSLPSGGPEVKKESCLPLSFGLDLKFVIPRRSDRTSELTAVAGLASSHTFAPSRLSTSSVNLPSFLVLATAPPPPAMSSSDATSDIPSSGGDTEHSLESNTLIVVLGASGDLAKKKVSSQSPQRSSPRESSSSVPPHRPSSSAQPSSPPVLSSQDCLDRLANIPALVSADVPCSLRSLRQRLPPQRHQRHRICSHQDGQRGQNSSHSPPTRSRHSDRSCWELRLGSRRAHVRWGHGDAVWSR